MAHTRHLNNWLPPADGMRPLPPLWHSAQWLRSQECSFGFMVPAEATMLVRVVHGDLLEQDVDVIVNAWNRNVIPWWLLIPQGVSRAIKRRAGYAPFRELGRMGSIPLGGAVVTSAGKLPHKAIIHVAGINLLWRASERSIRGSVQGAIALARDRGFKSIAFPLIGAGTGGRRQNVVLPIMEDELRHLEFDGEVRLVCYDAR